MEHGKVKPVDNLLVDNRPRALENNGRKKLDNREDTGVQKQISTYYIAVCISLRKFRGDTPVSFLKNFPKED